MHGWNIIQAFEVKQPARDPVRAVALFIQMYRFVYSSLGEGGNLSPSVFRE